MLKLILGGMTGGLSLLGMFLPGLAKWIGNAILQWQSTAASVEGKQEEQGTIVAGSWLQTVTQANHDRAEMRKNEGAWGPLGIITFWIGAIFATHLTAILLDSLPAHPQLTVVLFIVPWIEWVPHVIGSWHVAAFPKPLDTIELEVARALFVVTPPSAAAIAIARVFRK